MLKTGEMLNIVAQQQKGGGGWGEGGGHSLMYSLADWLTSPRNFNIFNIFNISREMLKFWFFKL